jgi:hypothetical protein
MAFGQDFTMSVTEPNPAAVDAGQDSSSYINLGTPGAPGGIVSLSCTVAPVVANAPTCTPPATATPPEQVAMSITVPSNTPAGVYTLTVTGTDPSGTQTATLSLTVLAVTPDYTIAVTTALFPTSVHAGFTSTAVITVSPIGGYSGTVTLSCRSVTPLATPAPFCTFSPAAVIVPGSSPTSTLTITTTGPTAPPPTSGSLPGGLGGPGSLWLTLPAFGLIVAGLISSGLRRRKLWAFSVLSLIAAALVFMPACSSSPNTNTGISGSTPKNTYVFKLTGADTTGVAPSNEATPPTVSLTVN